MARELKVTYQNPILYRFNQFTDYYNENSPDLTDKIRIGKKETATAILLAYWNKNKEEMAKCQDVPEFLPSLFTNNVELSERTLREDKSTSYRNVTWLLKLDLGDDLGMFMTKEFHGRLADYQIRINPFILCGKVVPNWGKASEKLENQDPIIKNQKAVEIALNSTVVAKCNLPTFTKTNYVNNTTTNPCGKVENISSTQKQQQKHFTKTKGGNSTLPEPNDNSLSTPTKTIKGGGGGGLHFESKSTTSPALNLKTKVQKGHNRTDIQDVNTAENLENVKFEAVERYTRGLVANFFHFASQTLYPTYIFSVKERNRIETIIYDSWYKKGVTANTSKNALDSHQETMFELVTIALQEVSLKQWSYIHPDAKMFFSHKFKHGLVRASDKFTQRKINRDTKLIAQAQKSVKMMLIPRGVKTVHTLPQLVRYWQHRLETTTYNPRICLNTFNNFLTNPKNLYNEVLRQFW
jgi:hypothetical protein